MYSRFFNKTRIEIPKWDSMLLELKETWVLNKYIYED